MTKKSSVLVTSMYVIGMLLFGSLNTITMKIQFSLSSVGVDGNEEQFTKPWFGTLNMFVGMTVVLFAEAIRQIAIRGKSSHSHPLMEDDHAEEDSRPKLSWGRKVVMVSIPAFFDLLATGLCCMGMLYIPASVWQMLRGAEIIFAAILAVLFLGASLRKYHLIGVLFCVLGVTCVGAANVLGGKAKGGGSSDAFMSIVGMSLVFFGQIVQAAQVIAEEWLLKDVDLPEMQIIGFEGFWGLLGMVLVVYPALYFIPGNDHGHLEDPIDTIALLKNSSSLMTMVVVYTFSCATYNVTGIAVTGALSAVHRTMLEASRTTIIWAFGLFYHYHVDAKSSFGEEITHYTWLQLVGFIVLLIGQAVYGEILRLPGFHYPDPSPVTQKFISPTGRSLMTPQLPSAGK